MERDEGLRVVVEAVADCLDQRAEGVEATSRLVADLGADSLDLLDLLFTLEKRFGVKLRQGGLDALSRLDVSDPAVVQDGYLTPDALARFAPWMPELRALTDGARVRPGQLLTMVTVETLWRAVERQLAAGEHTEPVR